jgi:hypothetical protein
MDPLDQVEVLGTMLAVAKLSRAYHDALIEEGWSPLAAWRLTLAWQHAVSGGKAPDSWGELPLSGDE